MSIIASDLCPACHNSLSALPDDHRECIVTEKDRLSRTREDGSRNQRKVYRVVGPSRAAGKIRVETWSHASRTWSWPHAKPADWFAPAPEEWPQTKAARRSLGPGSVARRRL